MARSQWRGLWYRPEIEQQQGDECNDRQQQQVEQIQCFGGGREPLAGYIADSALGLISRMWH
ncbi:MAG: hypothetical protein GY703_08935 [Gammaproteobacteria bacterium]|nr:hypothetical protein [Gammaproteobacteria bacterium]